VLNLLQFNAGVGMSQVTNPEQMRSSAAKQALLDVSIQQVDLLIQNVTAKVLLEARLQNLVLMINDTLSSIDLNPVIATLGQDVGSILNSTASGLASSSSSSSSSSLDRRSYELNNNVLYSINDYTGNTHTNRVLAQNGNIVDEYLDNDGNPHGQKVIGTYQTLMKFNGYETTVERNGEELTEKEYTYAPYHGINVISAIYTSADGDVVAAQILAESSVGGSSTIGDL
jgi:hypothetical protein